MGFWVTVPFFLTVLLIWAIYRKYQYSHPKNESFQQDFICPEGKFRIAGQKNGFTIHKDDRFTFHVVDGQIVSFVDKAVSDGTINYGGTTDGDV